MPNLGFDPTRKPVVLCVEDNATVTLLMGASSNRRIT